MSAQCVLTDERKAEFEASLDEALHEARAVQDMRLLRECRALFRKKIPWGLRGYVSALMALHVSEMPSRNPKMRHAAKQTQENAGAAGFAAKERRYHGEGVSLFVNAGRRQRLYARVILKALTDTESIAFEHIGDIRIMDNYTFVVVDPAVEEAALSALCNCEFKGRKLLANRAKRKDENSITENA